MATDKISALRHTALFGGFADEELQALAARSAERKLVRGEMLFVAGEEARGLYLIVTGTMRACVQGRRFKPPH